MKMRVLRRKVVNWTEARVEDNDGLSRASARRVSQGNPRGKMTGPGHHGR